MQPLIRKTVGKIPGATWNETQVLPGHRRITLLKSKEKEGRITKKLSKEFSRTESRILGAVSQLDEFLKNPLLQSHSGFATETSRNALNINNGLNEDASQGDLHPEARVSQSQTTQQEIFPEQKQFHVHQVVNEAAIPYFVGKIKSSSVNIPENELSEISIYRTSTRKSLKKMTESVK